MFCIGDRVVHPMHGAGVIADIVREKIAGCTQDYYVFKMPVGGLVLKIPVASGEMVGLRNIIAPEQAGTLLERIPELEFEITSNWSQRYRENMQRLKSGDLYEVCRVIKTLVARDRERGLSTGERKMLHTAKQILISELVLVLGLEYQCVEEQIRVAVSGDIAG